MTATATEISVLDGVSEPAGTNPQPAPAPRRRSSRERAAERSQARQAAKGSEKATEPKPAPEPQAQAPATAKPAPKVKPAPVGTPVLPVQRRLVLAEIDPAQTGYVVERIEGPAGWPTGEKARRVVLSGKAVPGWGKPGVENAEMHHAKSGQWFGKFRVLAVISKGKTTGKSPAEKLGVWQVTPDEK